MQKTAILARFNVLTKFLEKQDWSNRQFRVDLHGVILFIGEYKRWGFKMTMMIVISVILSRMTM
jgi:hypothetical protein